MQMLRLKKTSIFAAIKLSEGKVPNEVQVLRVGSFKHPQYGAFEITSQILAEMKVNYEKRVRGIDISFDYYHESGEDASAWVTELQLRENNSELWAVVEWTPKAQQKLSERELRYFSPDFGFQWTDPETGNVFNNVLFGGGLTNRPFVKEMQAIVADETQIERGHMKTELEKAQEALKLAEAKILKLSEDNADAAKKLAAIPPAPAGDDVAALKKTIEDLKAQLEKAQADNGAMMAEKAKAVEAQKLAEKTSEFNVLLTEGKACAAQKDAFLKGDMTEFIKLAEKPNLKPAGSSTSDDGHTDDVKAILKLAEEKQKASPGMSRGEAISIAKKELKK